MKKLCFLIVLLSFTQVFAKSRLNINLLGGSTDRNYGANTSSYTTLGLGGDLQVDLNGFLIGLSYISMDKSEGYPLKKESDLTMYGPYVGFRIGTRLDFLVGYGIGKSEYLEDDLTNAPQDLKRFHEGHGPFAGVRIHIFKFKYFDFGLGAHYYNLSDDSFEQATNGGAFSTVNSEAQSSGMLYMFTFSIRHYSVK